MREGEQHLWREMPTVACSWKPHRYEVSILVVWAKKVDAVFGGLEKQCHYATMKVRIERCS